MKKIIRRIVPLALLLCMILPTCQGVMAAEDNTLTISSDVIGAEFRIYKAGEFSYYPHISYTLAGGFEKYDIEFYGLDTEGWRKAATTLATYVDTDDSIKEIASKTNESGTVEFSGLEQGLYLVYAKSHEGEDGLIYNTEPAIVCLPNVDGNGGWTNEVTMVPKTSTQQPEPPGPSGPTMMELRLVVSWVGDTTEIRPDTVGYNLFCDGELYDKVILGDGASPIMRIAAFSAGDPNWQHVWEKVEKDHLWEVTQDDLGVEGYTTTYDREGNTFVVVNTYTPPEEPEEPREPGKGGRGDSYVIGVGTPEKGQPVENEHYTPPTPSTPQQPDNTPAPTIPGAPENVTPNVPEEPEAAEPAPSDNAEPEEGEPVIVETGLPQTGQLWWPLPILAGAGMILFLIGYIRKKGASDDEK